MPQFILLSFCNIPTQTTSPLLCLQVPDEMNDSFSYTPVSLGYPGLAFSATGLTSTRDKIFVLFSSHSNIFHIAALKKNNLSPVYYQEIPEVKDGHSILAINDCLYVISTGTDEVVCYDIQEKSVGNPRVIWRASNSQKDTHHINSIAEKKGEILISAFGPKAGELWATASNGYIYNITTNSLVTDGLYHPHSLTVRNNEVYYSDSHRKSFCALGQTNTIFNLDGYTRGISWLSNGLVCMATSIGRKVSKSTGLIANSADPGEPAGACSLLLGNISEQKVMRKIDLAWFGPEVYDVLVLPELQTSLLALSNFAHSAEREMIQILSRQLVESILQVQILSAQVSEKEQQVAVKEQQVAERDWQIANIEAQLSNVYASRSWQMTAPMRAVGAKLKQMRERRGAYAVDRSDSDKS